MISLLKYLKPYKLQVILVAVFTLLSSVPSPFFSILFNSCVTKGEVTCKARLISDAIFPSPFASFKNISAFASVFFHSTEGNDCFISA